MYIIDYIYENYAIVKSYHYGNNSNADLVVLCQHGFNGKEFSENFPDFFLPLNRYQPELASKFLELEHDYGATDLTFKIADLLKEKLNLIVVTINCDRAIMDANRMEDYCITPFIHKNLPKKTIDQIKTLNIFARDTVLSILEKTFKPQGYIIDIHSMWPFNVNINYENINDINQFISEFTSPKNKGTRRGINFITHNSKGELIANKSLSVFVEQELSKKGYLVKYNEPFYMLPIRSNYIYFRKYKGLAIDIPRNLLGKINSSNSINFYKMKKNKNSITSIANAIVLGILKLFD
ncbi:MAG: hypothetical protein AAGE84_13935 [Cyanobacteria bacterium P01_G01_bin.39]